HDGHALITPAVKVRQCLKSPLLISDGHECLAVNDGCARLNAMIFAQIDLIDIYLLFCRR
ncbi:hypothetical protein, partial [uncultured Selenomonas sp.]|uniref:hypothetical protein n=1 Tax=uncultured Selenomonas sp. TaxID=159275 RepID=UPI0028DCFA42